MQKMTAIEYLQSLAPDERGVVGQVILNAHAAGIPETDEAAFAILEISEFVKEVQPKLEETRDHLVEYENKYVELCRRLDEATQELNTLTSEIEQMRKQTND